MGVAEKGFIITEANIVIIRDHIRKVREAVNSLDDSGGKSAFAKKAHENINELEKLLGK